MNVLKDDFPVEVGSYTHAYAVDNPNKTMATIAVHFSLDILSCIEMASYLVLMHKDTHKNYLSLTLSKDVRCFLEEFDHVYI